MLAAADSPAYWLVDGVQALGKLPLNLAATRIDYAPFSGHKLYAPKGIGMLYVRAGAPFTPLMVGGGQEAGWRSGTENMAGIAAFGAVLDGLEGGRTLRHPNELSAMRDQLAGALRAAFPGLQFNAPFDKALPTTLNFSVPGRASAELLNCSTTPGFTSARAAPVRRVRPRPSHVLQAMDLPAGAALRRSGCRSARSTDTATIAAACDAIARCGAALAGHRWLRITRSPMLLRWPSFCGSTRMPPWSTCAKPTNTPLAVGCRSMDAPQSTYRWCN